MKAWLRTGAELLLVILLVPQVFVHGYYFTDFFSGRNPLPMLKSLSVYALTVSWVSAPFLALLTLLVKTLVRTNVRGWVVLLFCVGSGALWVAAWNLFVFNIFSYGRAAIPVVLCSLGTAGYALAGQLYRKGLPMPERKENEAAGLRE